MSTTLNPPTNTAVNGDSTVAHPRPVAEPTPPKQAPSPQLTEAIGPMSHRVGVIGLLCLRLAIGFEFLWAFIDKTFGFGWSTSSAHAWIHGGSPTTGFLSGVQAGPFQGFFNGIAGNAFVDWLFMLGLLGVGLALILGAPLRIAAISGATMLLMMYAASWPFAKIAGGQPTGSVNPLVDDHIVSLVALVIIGAFAAWSWGPVSRRWSALTTVRSHSWLR